MDVVFIDKKTEVEEGKEQIKTILRLDATKANQDRCTIMQIINATSKFNGISPWRDGSVTSLGEIKDWHNKNAKEDYDAYVYDGKEHLLSEYNEEKKEEDIPEEDENN